MVNSMADNKKLALALLKHDEARYHQLVEQVNGLTMPAGLELQTFTVEMKDLSLGAACNAVNRQTEAEYKLFFSDNVQYIYNKDIILLLIRALGVSKGATLIGLLGSSLPLGANFLGGKPRVFGRYDRQLGGEGPDRRPGAPPKVVQMEQVIAESSLVVQQVDALLPDVLAERGFTEWDESLQGVFATAAQAVRLRRRGEAAAVAKQNQSWCSYHDTCFFRQAKDEAYERERQAFCRRYPDEAEPLVSVLIPTYNQPEFFREALESALAQDYPRVEIIVGDDSTDTRTKELIQPYLAQHPDTISYEFHGGSLGGHGLGNMRSCLARSRGAYVNFLYHDDLFYPGKLRRMVEEYRRDLRDEVAFVTSARDLIDAQGKKLQDTFIYRPPKDECLPARTVGRTMLTYMHNCIGELTTMLLRREDALRFGHYFGVQDRSMWDVSTVLELCRSGRHGLYLSDTLSAFRRYGGQNTKNQEVVLTSRLDWFALLTLSYMHDKYLESEEEFWQLAKIYANTYCIQPLTEPQGGRSEEFSKELKVYDEVIKLALDDDREGFLKRMVEYMASYAERPEEMLAGTSFDRR